MKIIRYPRLLLRDMGNISRVFTQAKSFDELADARISTVESHGTTIKCYEYGPEDAEATVVFIHGFTLAAQSFIFQVKHLREHWPKVKIVLMDLRGHGDSDTVDLKECSINSAADDVLAAIDSRLRGKVIMVGHSLGSPVSLAVVRKSQAPDGMIQIAGSVEEMADAGAARILHSPVVRGVFAFFEKFPDSMNWLRSIFDVFLGPFLAGVVFLRDTPSEVVDFHAYMISATPSATILGFVDDLRQHDEVETMPKLRGVPGYVIAGESDVVVPVSQSELMVGMWPDAKMQIAHGAGHMVPLSAPGLVNTALDRLLTQLLKP